MKRWLALAVLASTVSFQGSGIGAPGAPGPDPEAAARANNLGVALLEQYRHPEAAEAFRKALALDPGFGPAQVNLGIALFYVPDLAAARQALAVALERRPDALQAHYVLGMIARQENRTADALKSYQRVLAADPGDLAANIGAAQVLLQERRYAEAIPLLETAARAEPYHVTAAYNLGLALTRAGRRDEGAQMMARFQELRDSPYKTALGNGYLEQGRYAEALATTGAEAERVDAAAPAVRFVDRSREWLPQPASGPAAPRAADEQTPAATLADLDGDGDLDWVDSAGGSLRLWRNQGGRFTDTTAASGVELAAEAAVAGDVDNDGVPDLLVLHSSGPRLLKGAGGGRFTDVTDAARIARGGSSLKTAALVDIDHDGDLDLFLPGTAANQVLRNNGDGSFKDVAAEAGLAQPKGRAIAVVPTDFDERRDVDLLVLHADAPPVLYKNLRNGSFADVAADVGLPADRGYRCVTAADVNKDGFTDFFFGATGAGTLALSDGRGRFKPTTAPAAAEAAQAALFVDYDRDGLLDLAVSTAAGPRLLRNLGSGWSDVSANAFGPQLASLGHALAAGDLDGDGAQELVVSDRAGIRLLHNQGGGGNAFRVDLSGRVSNPVGVGAKVELRAGSLRQKLESAAATPPPAPADLVFGLGRRTAPDAVRVLWPSGILQTEIEGLASAAPGRLASLAVKELDRKPSSCPYLYAWNGQDFAFVTDFLGAGELGYWTAPGVWNTPDPTERVRLTDDQLRPRDGRYELRVTNELEEALFLDRLSLLAVDHPGDVEVHPYEGMTSPPKPDRIYSLANARPPRSASDGHGHDVLERLRATDRTWPGDFGLHRIRGYGEEHALVLDLGSDAGERSALLLTAWTDYSFSSDNLAAHQAGLAMRPPSLQVRDASGAWRTAVEQVGIPVGRPQTVLVDLSGKWLGASREVRIVTNMRIYWDRVQVASIVDRELPQLRLHASRADLGERGFSAEVSPDGREPFGYDYRRVSWDSPWKAFPGRYTRVGDVRELLAAGDDLFVISRPGDEVALSFDATALPPLRAGWRRTFLLESDGYSKEMDINSATPDAIGPLPFHAMTRYPYTAPEAFPLTEARRLTLEAFTTRVVPAAVPSLDRAIVARLGAERILDGSAFERRSDRGP